MNVFVIQSDECESNISRSFRKSTFLNDGCIKIYDYQRKFQKRCKSLLHNFALPLRQKEQELRNQLNESCKCEECGGKVMKKILICQCQNLNESMFTKRSRYPTSPQHSIQPTQIRPSNKDLSMIGSSMHISEKLHRNTLQRNTRDSMIPIMQLIQVKNLLKKMSKTTKLEESYQQRMGNQTETLFIKVQEKLTSQQQELHLVPPESRKQSITFIKQEEIIKCKQQEQQQKQQSQSIKQSPRQIQYRIRTDCSNLLLQKTHSKPSISTHQNIITTNKRFSIQEFKSPRRLLRSEKYNQIQPLTQRVMCTYLKKNPFQKNNHIQ